MPSCTKAKTHIPQVVTYAVRESTKENKINLWLNHDSSTGAAAVGKKACLRINSEEIKPVAIAIIIQYSSIVYTVGIMKAWDFLSQNITSNQLNIYFVISRQDCLGIAKLKNVFGSTSTKLI